MKPEARAARERKQKIFVAVGGLLLVGMLAIQLPKILGGSSSPEVTPATTTDATGLPAQPTPTGATPVAAVTTLPEAAKVTSFSLFTLKDPFVQQVVAKAPVAPAPAGPTAGEKSAAGAGDAPATEFTTGGAAAAAVTIVTVNGARQVLEPGTKFPAGDPLFVLVAEKPDSKSVVIGIVGGAYSGGAKTTTLKAGKPITLVNTTTGARYKISLVSVGTGDSGAEAAPKP